MCFELASDVKQTGSEKFPKCNLGTYKLREPFFEWDSHIKKHTLSSDAINKIIAENTFNFGTETLIKCCLFFFISLIECFYDKKLH